MRLLHLGVALALLTTAIAAQREAFMPARLTRGRLPNAVPPNVVAGGQVLIEATVGRSGTLSRPVLLRGTNPFSDLVLGAIGGWQFTPAYTMDADGQKQPVESTVMIAAVYRPPTLLNAPTLGDPPKDVSAPSGNAPYPLAMRQPAHPPNAIGGSLVLFEVSLDEMGRMTGLRAVGSDPGFDGAARDALAQWTFRGGAYRGRAVPSTAYVMFGFPVPVLAPGARPPASSPSVPQR